MHVPKAFEVHDQAKLLAFMRQYSFATLISDSGGNLIASHLPMLVHEGTGGPDCLIGHMARGNPQWRHFDAEREVLVVVQGPHGYVSPSWYISHPTVPTWNYAAVHAYGIAEVVDDTETVRRTLAASVRKYESAFEKPWSLELPPEYLDKMMKGIVAFSISISRLQGKYKLSQNRSIQDQHGVVAALEAQSDPASADLATFMRQNGVL